MRISAAVIAARRLRRSAAIDVRGQPLRQARLEGIEDGPDLARARRRG